MHIRSSFNFPIAAAIAIFTCVPALAQVFHPYPEWGHEVWAGPEMVFNKRVQGEKGKLIHEYRLIDGTTAELLKQRKDGPFSPMESLPYYQQIVNWNGNTYRLGSTIRKDGKNRFLDILLTGMSAQDLSDIAPTAPIASIPGEWYGIGKRTVDYRISSDKSKLLIYVHNIFGSSKERQWACVVVDREGTAWTNVQDHPKKEVDIAKDFNVDDQGVTYVLSNSELVRIQDQDVKSFKVDVPTEDGLLAGAIHMNGRSPQIFGFIGQKDFKEPKMVVLELDLNTDALSILKESEFPYLANFEPREVIVKKGKDNYWLTASDRKYVTSQTSQNYTATNDMYICKVDLDGTLDWAHHMPKMMTTYHVHQPDVILHPQDDHLIVLFQDHPDALELRIKGEKPKYGLNKERSRDTEYEVIQMTVSPDQKAEYKWFEVDGARSRWGYIQQIDEDAYFSGNAHKDNKRGFFYWDF